MPPLPVFFPLALPFTLRQSDSRPELTAVYVVSIIFVIFACIGFGIFRTRRLDLLSLHSLQNPTPLSEIRPPRRRAGKTIRVHSYAPMKTHISVTCPICLEPLSDHAVSEGVCRHPLHTACLVQWLMRDPHLSCPVCRSTFQSITPKRPRSQADDEVEHHQEDALSHTSCDDHQHTTCLNSPPIQSRQETVDVLETAPLTAQSTSDIASQPHMLDETPSLFPRDAEANAMQTRS